MKYVYSYPEKSSLAHYTADVFVVRCFDNRFWKTFKHFMKNLGFRDLDPESVAGGAKIFASPEKEGDRDFMLRELEKSIKLHHTKRVMLFTHQECGAYGGKERFKNLDKEFEFHTEEHKKAKKVILDRFPELRVESYFINEDGIIKIE